MVETDTSNHKKIHAMLGKSDGYSIFIGLAHNKKLRGTQWEPE